MLLCDEKISKDNQLLDYMDTAEYLYRSMIKPSRASLLSNLMNSHPPTFHRIAALLGDDLKPSEEALLPFICLKRSKQIKYAKKFEEARNTFKIIANEKFKDFFRVQDVSLMLEDLGRRELYKLDLNNDFIFKNKITEEIIIGTLEDIQFHDDICDSEQYIINDIKTKQKLQLKSSLYSKKQINLNDSYFLKNETSLILSDVELHQDAKDGNYIFFDENKNKILKQISKTKLPTSIDFVKKFKDNDVFLRIKSEMKVYKCTNIIPAENFKDYMLEFVNFSEKDPKDQESLKFRLGKLIIHPKNIYLPLRRNISYRKSEIELIRWLIKNQLRTTIFLKKPVNNLEVGVIKNVINVNIEQVEKGSIEDNIKGEIVIRNIFRKEKSIDYKTIETISFEYGTAMIQKKSETSIFSRFGYKLVKKFKPEKVMI